MAKEITCSKIATFDEWQVVYDGRVLGRAIAVYTPVEILWKVVGWKENYTTLQDAAHFMWIFRLGEHETLPEVVIIE